MERRDFYHMYANGDDAKNFIVCEADFAYEFNLIAISSLLSKASVLAFSLEDTHPHILLYATHDQAVSFKSHFENSSIRHISATRGSSDGVRLQCSLDLIVDEDHLMNVAAYVIIQSTKDGKPVMYYDYKWGTGSLYFRTVPYIPVWLLDEQSSPIVPVRFGDMKAAEQKAMNSRIHLPDGWLIAGGLILPQNYLDIKRYESIFRTHNCFRVFVGAGRKKITEVTGQMAMSRGVLMEDLEAREKCRALAKSLFGTCDVRRMDVQRRLRLAVELYREYRLAYRQLALLTRLPESEIRKYLK